ncbi:unnamed protein product, partial [Iphiclides podalirius]
MGPAVVITFCFGFLQLGTALGSSVEGRLHFPELGATRGHTVEEYDVITEDGYILRLFRIRGARKRPILLMHGLLDSSDTWTVRGNASLAATLAAEGHDVWLGNCRGNRYARRHIYLDPEAGDGFWDYSFHEHGFYDLSAIIDSVLSLTGADRLDAVGHSQGATIFYVLGSTRPEYNRRVNLLVALGPVCYLQNVGPPLKTLIRHSTLIYEMATSLQWQEVFGESGWPATLKSLCLTPLIGYTMCVSSALFLITGRDEDELETGIVPALIERFPMATSAKNLYHFAQVGHRRAFARFDHGPEGNLESYGDQTPPAYDLDSVTMRVALFAGGNDGLSTLEDVAILRNRLPNVVQHTIMPHRMMNHADFVWGRHMDEYLFPYILDVLQTYGEQEYPDNFE